MRTTLFTELELEAVRRKFPCPSLRRQKALRLISLFVPTMSKARQQIEGPHAPLKPMKNRTPKEWHRETIITALNTPL